MGELIRASLHMCEQFVPSLLKNPPSSLTQMFRNRSAGCHGYSRVLLLGGGGGGARGLLLGFAVRVEGAAVDVAVPEPEGVAQPRVLLLVRLCNRVRVLPAASRPDEQSVSIWGARNRMKLLSWTQPILLSG